MKNKINPIVPNSQTSGITVSNRTDFIYSCCTREHDSLKISNGMWFWFSRGIGGKSALDYLIKVKGHTLPEAVNMINGRTVSQQPVFFLQ